ncbi:MAG: 2,3-bisphosphoglycerate-independent phosphoglycerate mutase [Casimicrobiaceae bacterium]|nr:2,3-bisphosphoglycerate-independent phosphoglycerate mutase [Casimicrobiaceae bacterium]
MPAPAVTPVILIILDGFGYREAAPDNAISLAHTPTWDRLLGSCPWGTIDASEHHVGLPRGQFGNSEVGHLNLGAGRIVYQDLTRVDRALETGEFDTNPALVGAVEAAKASGGTLHVLGLLSPGGVHSHERHIHAMLRLAKSRGLTRVALHAFLDGRDVPPKSAAGSLAAAEAVCAETGARIATVSGRFYAMDRDRRWERIEAAWRAIVEAASEHRAATAAEALEAAYARGETDEFVLPTLIGTGARVEDGDAAVFMNFRADRAREMTSALTEADFSGFARSRFPKLSAFACLSFYGEAYAHLPTAFRNEVVQESFGEVVSRSGLKQLRLAETEKYAHVTYFFSGGREQPFEGEERILVPSPKVATYDLKPEMSAPEVTDRLVEAIASRRFHAIVVNYANGDMVGHTGVLQAAVRAVETLDACLARVLEAARAAGYEVVITADHGNCEQMFDAEAGQPHTQHTTDRVPFLYVGRRTQVRVRDGGALRDVAPTLLELMGLEKPASMTGQSLLVASSAGSIDRLRQPD